ncbi:class I SAM-dependent methyltransferase [Rhizobium leguminosarum bv. viciae 248]|uniref:class I SAM-dependent methyltransferase n=1 Tax=Rhizobium leguminosarum TaxID=384 RepID=UPI0003679CDC|nr:methyltransferase domain-containing protein [Rhizobium leguminosarum]MCA2407466.1 class I SAM-dependent methyltransferase [Rhizobium leguminosarum]NKM62721.1 methyltransferase domain-containing protein [Rhizobium leguminosarum bv. viciae]QHW23683.1 class I SAM-dependent methyltransferase [Rhizobium leguminosarum bv. viciae 248]
METESALYESDLAQTLANRERLSANPNLMHWYGELYKEMFRQEPDIASKTVLEIGSGTSPLKRFLPNVITSDVLKLDYLDIVFDCHEIGTLPDIADRSVDVITMTNVLHHLKDPLAFLRGATRKLAKGGRVYATEPYLSWLSYPMYKLLHHEPVDLSIHRPVLDKVQGPLSTSNQAMPHMIFFQRPDWLAELADCYSVDKTRISYFTSLSYMATGGISKKFPVPGWAYKPYFKIDKAMSRTLPKLFASFFTVCLVSKGEA